MGNLRTGHVVEAAIWLLVSAVLYIYSFPFDQEIEIYKFGASAWPRAILLLIVIASLGQLVGHYQQGDESGISQIGQASDDSATDPDQDSSHNSPKWYVWTFSLLLIPFLYLLVPGWLVAVFSLDDSALHAAKLVCAAILIVGFIFLSRGNHVGGILALPILFAAMLADVGFYVLVPVLILSVMYFMGEKRLGRMVLVTLFLYGVLLLLFVSLLYVGLPTGNISPFYEIGTGMVNILQ